MAEFETKVGVSSSEPLDEDSGRTVGEDGVSLGAVSILTQARITRKSWGCRDVEWRLPW